MAVALLAATLIATPAAHGIVTEPGEEHCVLDIVDQLLDGELITAPPICFPTFAEAMDFIGVGGPDDPLGGITNGAQLMKVRPDLGDPIVSPVRIVPAAAPRGEWMAVRYSHTRVLGIHFDGRYGSGSSVTVVGSSSTACSGGYWNASSYWRDRISSTYNGCYRLTHYTGRSTSGSAFNTYTRGQTDTLSSWIDNRTESVRYSG